MYPMDPKVKYPMHPKVKASQPNRVKWNRRGAPTGFTCQALGPPICTYIYINNRVEWNRRGAPTGKFCQALGPPTCTSTNDLQVLGPWANYLSFLSHMNHMHWLHSNMYPITLMLLIYSINNHVIPCLISYHYPYDHINTHNSISYGSYNQQPIQINNQSFHTSLIINIF